MKKRLNLLPKQDAQKSTGEQRREARLARIAGALASGASITAIAAKEGISRVIASREANSSNCRQLIATFVDEERELMFGLCYRATRVIEEALAAMREYTTKDGKVFGGGPDHYARLAATKHLRDLLGAGQPPPKPVEEQPRTLTLDDLKRLFMSGTTGRQALREMEEEAAEREAAA